MNEFDIRTERRLRAIEAACSRTALSAIELADTIHICHQSALDYVRRLRATNRLRIAGWRDTAPGKRAALYLWGSGPDVAKPPPKTRVQLQRDFKARLRKDAVAYELFLAAARARYAASKAATRKNTWIGALTQ